MGKSWENPTTKKGLHGKFMGNPTKIDVHMGNSWEHQTKMRVYIVKSSETHNDKWRFTWEFNGKPNKNKCARRNITGKPNKNRCLHDDETGSPLARYRIDAPKSLPDLPLGPIGWHCGSPFSRRVLRGCKNSIRRKHEKTENIASCLDIQIYRLPSCKSAQLDMENCLKNMGFPCRIYGIGGWHQPNTVQPCHVLTQALPAKENISSCQRGP